jgi:2-polyprenyl-6-hydroxyphenyl methylase/3-demethylubiquinone-9 3-methyltransferase
MMAKQAALHPPHDASPSVDPAEVEQFDAIAGRWWDPEGPFRPLHRLTPARMTYLRDRMAGHFARDITADAPFDGLCAVDIGCGGGLISEPLARLGLVVTGVDAGANNIAAARAHAAGQGLAIDYRCATAETIAAGGERFDVVFALEIIEHVADRKAFVGACASLARPGGLIVFSTINRTAKAFALAVVGAEYILRWLPRGSHQWRKFVRPSELARDLRAAGARPVDTTGLVFDPLDNRWHLAADLDVNYFLTAEFEQGS